MSTFEKACEDFYDGKTHNVYRKKWRKNKSCCVNARGGLARLKDNGVYIPLSASDRLQDDWVIE